MSIIAHIHTVDGVTVILKGRPVHVAKDAKYYEETIEAIQGGWSAEYILDLIERVKRQLETMTGDVRYANGVVTYQGNKLHGYAVEKLIGLINAKQDTVGLTKFLEKLQANPSMQTREDLYAFLEHGRMPINQEGNFLAYKAIRKNFFDIHSNSFRNQIGDICEMPRIDVDDRRENTCSRGFHVCSYDYLQHFQHADGHVMICEIDPADVVSIPADYNNTKMRVSKYKVIGEVDNGDNVLSTTDVWKEEYELLGKDKVTGNWEHIDYYQDRDTAVDEGDADIEFGGWDAVKVVNSNGVKVYFRG